MAFVGMQCRIVNTKVHGGNQRQILGDKAPVQPSVDMNQIGPRWWGWHLDQPREVLCVMGQPGDFAVNPTKQQALGQLFREAVRAAAGADGGEPDSGFGMAVHVLSAD